MTDTFFKFIICTYVWYIHTFAIFLWSLFMIWMYYVYYTLLLIYFIHYGKLSRSDQISRRFSKCGVARCLRSRWCCASLPIDPRLWCLRNETNFYLISFNQKGRFHGRHCARVEKINRVNCPAFPAIEACEIASGENVNDLSKLLFQQLTRINYSRYKIMCDELSERDNGMKFILKALLLYLYWQMRCNRSLVWRWANIYFGNGCEFHPLFHT